MKNSTHSIFVALIGLILFILPANLLAQATHYVAVTSNVYTPKNITVNVGDTVVWTCTQGRHNVNGNTSTFPNNAEGFGNSLGSNWTFKHVFKRTGKNDYQCDPHVGFGMVGTVTVLEAEEDPVLTLSFNGMTPHVGQMLSLYIKDLSSGQYVDTLILDPIPAASFQLESRKIELGASYNIDFFSDHNGNKQYDAPPTDHAWRLVLSEVAGDTELSFTHNTNFTNIFESSEENPLLTLSFNGMTPHVGQMLSLYIKDLSSGQYVDTLILDPIPAASFQLESRKIELGASYNIDFFSDHNGNKQYDAPPTDHAWRLVLSEVAGDTEISFTHNTNFTNIFGSTGLEQNLLQDVVFFPNPVSDQLNISFGKSMPSSIELANMHGQVVWRKDGAEIQSNIKIDVSHLSSGLYFLKLSTQDEQVIQRIIRQ